MLLIIAVIYFSHIFITCKSSAGEGHEFCIATRGQDPCPHLIHATIPCSNKTINDPLQRCSNLNCISLARNWVKSHVTQSFKLKTPLAQHLAHHHLVTLASQQFFQPKNPKHIQHPAYHAPTQPNPTVHITQPINPSSNNSPGFRTHHDFDFESVETNGDRLVHQLRYLDLWNKKNHFEPVGFLGAFFRPFRKIFGAAKKNNSVTESQYLKGDDEFDGKQKQEMMVEMIY